MHDEGETAREAAPDPAPPSSGLLTEIGQLGRAVKQLFGAQMHLLAAELGLARSAISWLLVAGLAATVAGVGVGLTALGLIGVLLADWFGSWTWALLVLVVLQLMFLIGAILLFRRCMHWMSLPATRGEWSAMIRDAGHNADARSESDKRREERS
ncbi:ABC transporter ATP-binding protein [Rhodanobacter ginsengisoli]|uniref:ABC transporter ATP-binding protein n=1 Tax=Rhodanobacter ginsengisoli TaxID=418646 RepID=A0ABW0QRI7_9GAMM